MSIRKTPLGTVGFIALVAGAGAVAEAQIPGVATLQNAFVNPGITVAGNLATGDGSTIGAAAAWAPTSGRFQLSGGLVARRPEAGGTAAAYGARATAPLWSMGQSIGVALFGGIGASGQASDADSLAARLAVAGASVGYRRAIGDTRGFSVYASPAFTWWTSEGGTTANALRVGVGLDIGVTRSIGATVGMETGRSADPGEPGPSGVIWGFALSYAMGR